MIIFVDSHHLMLVDYSVSVDNSLVTISRIRPMMLLYQVCLNMFLSNNTKNRSRAFFFSCLYLNKIVSKYVSCQSFCFRSLLLRYVRTPYDFRLRSTLGGTTPPLLPLPVRSPRPLLVHQSQPRRLLVYHPFQLG